METLNNQIYCFRADRKDGRPVTDDEIQEDTESVEVIFCKACGLTVTSRDQKIGVQGSHRHTFFNPAGIVFELGCFAQAPGCSLAGEPTSEFTWFAGYVWSFALCRKCKAHLGWFFEKDSTTFYGLILAKLVG
ncbi:MAG: cereblon family protein [Desulforhopalus sp.]